MNHVNDEDAVPAAPSGDRSDAALDAAFSAANAGMVAAIRRGCDLDAGLARIIGAPPQGEVRSPESPAENTWKRLLSLAPRPNTGWPQLDPYICAAEPGGRICHGAAEGGSK